MNARTQDVILKDDEERPLTEKQRAFARNVVEFRNFTTAYRMTYDVGYDTQPQTVWQNASTLMQHSGIKALVAELRERAESEVIGRARELFGDLVDIAGNDPNDIIRRESRCCRHCYGAGHAYQWQDAEWAIKAAEAIDLQMRPPSDVGGFGFDPTRGPNPVCPHCYGQGVHVVFVADTAKLNAKARKSYKGVKLKADGSLEMLMEDKADARKEIAKILGIYRDGKGGGGLGDLAPPSAAIAADATPEAASANYLEMLG